MDKSQMPGFVTRLAAIGDRPDDNDEERLRHTFMVLGGSLMSLGGVLWGSICLAFGLLPQASIPYGYTLLTFVNFAAFRATKDFGVARSVQIGMSLLLPFMFQWSLGGFVPSGAVMLWSMLALIGAFSFTETRHSYWVLSGFLLLTVVSAAIDSWVKRFGLNVSPTVSTVFFAVNISIIGTCLVGLTLYFVRQAEEARVIQQLDQLRSDFLSTVSHELRTPLTSILGFTEMIRKRLDTAILPQVATTDPRTTRAIEQVHTNIGIILDEGKRLTDLINDVLDITKMESGAIEWRREPVSVSDIVARVGEVTSALFTAKPGLRFVTELESGLPTIVGDPDRLLQVLLNLVSNAVKFTSEGEIRVSARQQHRTEGPVIEIVVADTGYGIAPEDVGQIFERFKQVGDTLTDRPTGTGLGLPISQFITRHHGGDIWVESELGKGSRFHVVLPVPPDTDDLPNADALLDAGALTDTGRTPEAAAPASADGAAVARRIMVVDDDPKILELLHQELDDATHEVIRCSSAEKALEEIARRPPHVLVVDVMLPGMSGVELADALRHDAGTAKIPIVMISAAENRERSEAAGAACYFSKPIDLGKLHAEVNSLLRGDGGDEPPQPGQRTILVVDDEASIRVLLRQQFEDAGFLVEESENGIQALEQAKRVRPDLVILDVIMPGMGGFDVAAVLKHDPVTMHVPIIILSVTEDLRRGELVGIDRYFKKPVDPGYLSREVAALITDGATGATP